MKTREKIAILMAAVLLTIFGFSLMAAPSVELMKVGKDAGYETIVNHLAKADVTVHASLRG